jgi:hypothetical protein
MIFYDKPKPSVGPSSRTRAKEGESEQLLAQASLNSNLCSSRLQSGPGSIDVMSKFTGGVPTPKRPSLAMRSASPERQFRNGNDYRLRTSKRNRTPPIEISDSDSDGNRGLATRSMSPIKEVSADNSTDSEERPDYRKRQHANANSRQKKTEAFISGRIRRKSDSPETPFRRDHAAKILVSDSQESSHSHNSPPGLYGDRHFKLVEEPNTGSHGSGVDASLLNNSHSNTKTGHTKSEEKLLQNGMKGKDGKVQVVQSRFATRSLGNSVTSSLKKKTPSMIESPTSASAQHQRDSPLQFEETSLQRTSFFGWGAIGELNRPSLQWNSKGEFALRWQTATQVSGRITIIPNEIAEFRVS